jgi:Transposase
MWSQVFVGIDVAKAQWDMARRPSGERWAVTNDDAGIAALVTRLQAIAPQLMVLEATGTYQRVAVAALAAAGLPVAVVHPRHARDVAQATGPLAKTDALEARALAHVAEAVCPRPRPLPDAQADELCALLARRQPLVAIRTAEQHRFGSAPRGSSQTSRLLSPGSTPGWQPWTTTSTRRGGRVRCGGNVRSCSAASLVLAPSVPARYGSTCRSGAR